MNKVLKALSITLLWLAGAGDLLAAPGQGGDWRDGPRATRRDRYAERQDGPRFRDQNNYGQDRQRAGPPDSRRYPDQNSYRRPYDDGQDMQRRSGRLSPEERRALRRQIDEAGRDIYAPYPRTPR